jgi:hypothetical protein
MCVKEKKQSKISWHRERQGKKRTESSNVFHCRWILVMAEGKNILTLKKTKPSLETLGLMGTFRPNDKFSLGRQFTLHRSVAFDFVDIKRWLWIVLGLSWLCSQATGPSKSASHPNLYGSIMMQLFLVPVSATAIIIMVIMKT